MPRVRVPRHVVRLVTRFVTWLVIDYFTYAARPVASARRAACRVTHRRLLRLAQARRRLLRLRRTSGCLGTSRGSSRSSSSTTSTTPRVRVPRLVARLITRLVAPLVVDYFAYLAPPGASTRHVAHLAARRRLLHLRNTFGCFGTSHDLSSNSSLTTSPRAGSSSTTSPRAGSPLTTSPTYHVRVPRHVARLVTRLVVNYFDCAARLGVLARRAARHVAHRRLLHLRRASGCFGTSHGLLRDSSSTTLPRAGSSSTTSPRAGSSSTTSPTPRVRMPRHVVQLVTWLVIDYFDYVTRPGASARRVAHLAARRRLLRVAQARR
jgi:hypothetical protein